MGNTLRPTCEIYVDFSGDREDLQRIVSEAVDGKLESFFTVVSNVLDISVKENELFNSPKYGGAIPPAEAPNHYLYFKFRLNVSPASDNVSDSIFSQSIEDLVKKISIFGINVKADDIILV